MFFLFSGIVTANHGTRQIELERIDFRENFEDGFSRKAIQYVVFTIGFRKQGKYFFRKFSRKFRDNISTVLQTINLQDRLSLYQSHSADTVYSVCTCTSFSSTRQLFIGYLLLCLFKFFLFKLFFGACKEVRVVKRVYRMNCSMLKGKKLREPSNS